MATSKHPAWAYKPRSNDPDVIKSAVSKMDDCIGRVEFTDLVDCPFTRSVLSTMDGSATEVSGYKLTVDFKNRQIWLPKLTLSSQYLPSIVEGNLIRYAAFILPPGYDTRSKEMHVVVLSTWQKQNKDIHNIYLVMNECEALLIMNAVSRLISMHSLTKALEFYPLLTGRVMVSRCTSGLHSGNNTDCCSPQRLMSFILDPESLSIFEHNFTNKPTYDFRFYKEQGPRVLDIVFVSKDMSHINLQQQTQVYIIRKYLNSKTDEEAYDKLLEMFMEDIIKPQPEEYFFTPQLVRGSSNEGQLESGWQESRWQRLDEQDLYERWLNDLYTGDHIHRNLDDALQLMWVTFEHDLRECIENSAVPDSVIESAGLDPFSRNHLQQSLEDIKDQLLNNDMVLALSRLQACLSIYKDTLLQPVSTLDQAELMKRIYFLSSRD